jgi:TIR domain
LYDPGVPVDTGFSVFISYSHKDETLMERLREHLSTLRRGGVISDWHDREIPPGEDWKREIDEHLEEASLILLLISPAFIASDYCYAIEGQRALERHDAREAKAISIMLRPVDVPDEIGRLQMLPDRARPVTTWSNRDEAFKSIVDGIKVAIKELTESSTDVSRMDATPPKPSGGGSATQRADETAARSNQTSAEQRLLQRLRTHQNDLERLVSAQLALLDVDEAVQLIEAWRDDPEKLDANPAMKGMVVDHLGDIAPLSALLEPLDPERIEDDQYQARARRLIDEAVAFDTALADVQAWGQRVADGGAVAPLPELTALQRSAAAITDKLVPPCSKRLLDELRALIDRFSDIEDFRLTAGAAPSTQTFTPAREREGRHQQQPTRSPLGVQGT